MERLRYVPLGWSKRYEFGEHDVRVAYTLAERWSDQEAGWCVLEALLLYSVYGAYMENEFDVRVLKSIVHAVFGGRFWVDQISVSHSLSHAEILDWVDQVPAEYCPTRVHLPVWADCTIHEQRAFHTITQCAQLFFHSNTALASTSLTNERWMHVVDSARVWLQALPDRVSAIETSVDDYRYRTVWRYMEREVRCAQRVLAIVRSDLQCVIGTQQWGSRCTKVLALLATHRVPAWWRCYGMPENVLLDVWIQDLVMRFHSLDNLVAAVNQYGLVEALARTPVDVGKCFFPEAFSTATRQMAARVLRVPYEQLRLTVGVGRVVVSGRDESRVMVSGVVSGRGESRVMVSGVVLSGAVFDAASGAVVLSRSAEDVRLPPMSLEWSVESVCEKEGLCLPVERASEKERLWLPVYLDRTRRKVLFPVAFNAGAADPAVFYEHGAACFASHYRV